MPDENFAREVLQLFSLGLVELAPDGQPRLLAIQPEELCASDDISGLASVFTGFSWDCLAWPSRNCFTSGSDNGQSDLERWNKPMRRRSAFRSGEEKRCLDLLIPPQAELDPAASLARYACAAEEAVQRQPARARVIGKRAGRTVVAAVEDAAVVEHRAVEA